jgi:hypothetical protein
MRVLIMHYLSPNQAIERNGNGGGRYELDGGDIEALFEAAERLLETSRAAEMAFHQLSKAKAGSRAE